MSFAKHIQATSTRLLGKSNQFGLRQHRHNKENRISRVGSGFQQLELVDDEILAQAWQIRSGRGASQVLQRPLKEFFVGQD